MSDVRLAAAASTNFLHVSEERRALGDYKHEYDLFISLASWEKRGLAISEQTGVRAARAMVCYFNPSHAPSATIIKARSAIKAGLKGRVEKFDFVELKRSTDYRESTNLLIDRVSDFCDRVRYPRIAIDISSLPIGYLQGLVGSLIARGKTPLIDCYYVEPVYSPSLDAPLNAGFTQGSWRLTGVPFLEGQPSGSPRKCIMVCIGAESGSTRELLFDREYTQVAIVKPETGGLSEWSEQIKRDCDELVSTLNVVGDAFYAAESFSVTSVVSYYTKTVLPAWRDAQRMFVAIGPKPHGLAGVMCGFSDSRLSVFARVPSGYIVRQVEPGAHAWRYMIRDLSSPAWARSNYPDWAS